MKQEAQYSGGAPPQTPSSKITSGVNTGSESTDTSAASLMYPQILIQKSSLMYDLILAKMSHKLYQNRDYRKYYVETQR